VYPALLPLMRTPRLPVVDCTDAPADRTRNLLTTTIVAPPSNASKWQMGFNSAFKELNELIRFAERRNLVSVRVPSHFNWPLRT